MSGQEPTREKGSTSRPANALGERAQGKNARSEAASEQGVAMQAVCDVCPHACKLCEGQLGLCRARVAHNGHVVSQNYGRVTSIAQDPIEKKPLANYLPGSTVLSVGSYGCNLRCPFCQNWSISQAEQKDVPWREISPTELVGLARRLHQQDHNMVGIAYTYNEPLVGWEYVRDCSQLAHNEGLVNVLVSNGCANAAVIEQLAGLIDAANIDLKGADQHFYDQCAGDFDCVQQTIRALAATPTCHLELTTLVIPGMNDTDQDIQKIARWVSSLHNEGDPITLHVTRFFPRWHMQDRGPTPVSTVYHLADVARRWVQRVEVGNC